MTIELVLLYLTNELIRLYDECRVGQIEQNEFSVARRVSTQGTNSRFAVQAGGCCFLQK